MNLTVALEDVESRHRKEKKELQAHLTAIKKTAKNDKSKKKELTAEIAKLESELEIRHKKELEAFENEQHESESTIKAGDADVEDVKIKVSKAQKRRDKKSLQEKERVEQIKIQEKENVHGPRNLENQLITAKLKNKNFKIFSIPSDGDCLYQAVAHQIATTRACTITVEQLRKNTAEYIKKNKDDFIPFMSNPESSEMLTEMEFNDYCDDIINTKVWGGQLEIKALSNYLKCPISVIQAEGPESIDQGTNFDGPPLILTYHRHMYKLGEHYNSTQVISGNNDEDI